MLQKLFARIDQDGDGAITAEEFTAAMEKRRGPEAEKTAETTSDAASAFSAADEDGDGLVSESEFRTAMEAMRGQGNPPPPPPPAEEEGKGFVNDLFAELDSDGDGAVSLESIVAALSGGDETATAAVSGSEEATATTSGAATETDTALQTALATFDTDGDGKLSAQEFGLLMQRLLSARESESTASAYTAMGASTATGGVAGVALDTEA
ncbi:EF-hand domain-containing protein [Opitutus sp. ER46]|uniref:EF-hand domain-containing protein n=1 Tax=Opitutus sp. ER46 TaxID=2161864 RepID=UPI00130502AC|nr:EF-hand domain-containing protein [Opitutus sp. ER46]